MLSLIITENQSNQRLDRFLKKYFDAAPLSVIYKMIRKDIKLNGKRAKEDTMLNTGDELSIYITTEEAEKLSKKRIQVKVKKQFGIAYEDANILVAEKPFGLLTHGDSTEKKNHLANQVIDYLIERQEYDPHSEKTFSPAPCNRLDRNTTGLVLFGKNAAALQDLNEMIRKNDVVLKYYRTIVSGKFPEKMVLKDRMTKDSHNNTVAVIDKNSDEGKLMETRVCPMAYGQYLGKWYTLLEVEIITGRTHQIRAHLANSGFPVIGDSKYGDFRINSIIKKEFNWTTQLLHAYRLEFTHIKDESPLKYLEGRQITSELPPAFKHIQETIFK